MRFLFLLFLLGVFGDNRGPVPNPDFWATTAKIPVEPILNQTVSYTTQSQVVEIDEDVTAGCPLPTFTLLLTGAALLFAI